MVFAVAAEAQRAVVFGFASDRGDKVRGELVDALEAQGELELVPVTAYRKAAKKHRGKLVKVAAALSLDVIVTGVVKRSELELKLLDGRGRTFFAREVPLKGGRLGREASKLAKSIASATSPAREAEPREDAPPPRPAREEPEAESLVAEAQRDEPEPREESREAAAYNARELPSVSVEVEAPAAERERIQREELLESHTYVEARPEKERRAAGRPGGKLVTLALARTNTWRSYCLRPKVSSCKEYDQLETKPQGAFADVKPGEPYGGFALLVSTFPLRFVDGPLSGLGLHGEYARGFSSVRVTAEQNGTPLEKLIVSQDQAFGASAVYRHHVDLFSDAPFYGQARAGFLSRTFDGGDDPVLKLPATHRTYAALGADIGVSPFSWLNLEAGFTYLPKSHAGDDGLRAAGGRGGGLSFEAAAFGTLWRQFGYSVRFRWTRFDDLATGDGGGAAQESYADIVWGLTASL